MAVGSTIVDLPPAANKRVQSREEEIANALSHGLGLIAALAATPFLILHAVRNGDAAFIVGTSIFAATMVLLYFASTCLASSGALPGPGWR